MALPGTKEGRRKRDRHDNPYADGVGALEELARMLGGISISQKVREHARELLKRSTESGERTTEGV